LFYKTLIRPLLFVMDAERAHHFTFRLLRLMLAIPGLTTLFRALYLVRDSRLERTVFGLTFPNSVGLAAGFDKEGYLNERWEHLGFGFVEVGTVTPLPQPGNDLPRLFRLPQDKAVINRMGFNSGGMEAMIPRLQAMRQRKIIVGANIGKNKATPNAEAERDYQACFQGLFPYVDYFVVNVSSPNTPGLRALQEKEPLQRLLASLQTLNLATGQPKPLLLKIAPDLTNEQLDDILEIARVTPLAGIVATNTTLSRAGLSTSSEAVAALGAGGLSGAPLRQRATEVVRYLHENSGGQLPIIAVGGIMEPADALEKLAAGASLVQVYTGYVYAGPALPKRINQAILQQAPRC